MSTRSISVPFAYNAWVRTGRGKSVERWYREVHEFEMPIHEGIDSVCFWPRGEGGTNETKILDGRPSNLVLRGIGTPVLEADFRFPEMMARVLSNHLASVSKGFEVKLKGPPRPETVEISHRDDVVDRVVKECARLSIVDGELHREAIAPVLVASSKTVRVGSVDDRRFEDVFRIDELDLAVERAAILGGIIPAEIVRPEIELISTDWLDEEVFELSARAGINRFLKESGAMLHLLPIEAMEAFCDLRDAKAVEPFDRPGCLDALDRMLAVPGIDVFHGTALAVARHMLVVDACRRIKSPSPAPRP